MKLDFLGVLEINFTFRGYGGDAGARIERDNKMQHLIKCAAGVSNGNVAGGLAVLGVIVGNYNLLFAWRGHTLVDSNLRATQSIR